MSKTLKFQIRLNSLEDEYKGLLQEELRRISEGEISQYLEEKNAALLTSKEKKSPRVDKMEQLEKEIYLLDEKLGITAKDSVVGILEEFLHEEEKAKRIFFASREDKKRIARSLLQKHWNL